MGNRRLPILKLWNYPDCSALTENGGCKWLTLAKCQKADCPFIRNEERLRLSQEHVYQRLLSLDEETQAHISKKYYAGKRPWYEE